MLDTCCKIVFVDGHLSLLESQIPDGLICLALKEAMGTYGIFLRKFLKGADFEQGAFIYLPSNKVVKDLHIEHHFTRNAVASPRLVISLGKLSHLQIVQHWNLDDTIVNGHVDAVLDAGSHLDIKTVQKKSSSTFTQTFHASVKKDAKLAARLYCEGAKQSCHSMKVQLLEENAEALLEGFSNLDVSHGLINSAVEHLAPHTQSRQHFKALLKGKAFSSFEGKIFVDPIAQKTQGYQLSNNLLLSDEATVHVKPNLEIFADDVKASHGATITQLDDEALFYLTSRGIPKQEAKDYLVHSFANELAQCLP